MQKRQLVIFYDTDDATAQEQVNLFLKTRLEIDIIDIQFQSYKQAQGDRFPSFAIMVIYRGDVQEPNKQESGCP